MFFFLLKRRVAFWGDAVLCVQSCIGAQHATSIQLAAMETDPAAIQRYAERQLRMDKQLQVVAAARCALQQRMRLYEVQVELIQYSKRIAELEIEYWQTQEELCRLMASHVHCPPRDEVGHNQTCVGELFPLST